MPLLCGSALYLRKSPRCHAFPLLRSAWPIYPVPSLVVAIHPVAFALTRRATAKLLSSTHCRANAVRIGAVLARALLCPALPSLYSWLPRSSFAFLPTASLCLCSGSPYRRGSVLGWSKLCRRRAAPCVVWLFNAVACHSNSYLLYALPSLIGTQPINAPAGHSISYLRCANAKHFGATPPLSFF